VPRELALQPKYERRVRLGARVDLHEVTDADFGTEGIMKGGFLKVG
jgi:hypothetical protein